MLQGGSPVELPLSSVVDCGIVFQNHVPFTHLEHDVCLQSVELVDDTLKFTLHDTQAPAYAYVAEFPVLSPSGTVATLSGPQGRCSGFLVIDDISALLELLAAGELVEGAAPGILEARTIQTLYGTTVASIAAYGQDPTPWNQEGTVPDAPTYTEKLPATTEIITIASGYSTTVNGVVDTKTINVSAIPGSGRGFYTQWEALEDAEGNKAPTCKDIISTINGESADQAGQFTIECDAGLAVEADPTVVDEEGVIHGILITARNISDVFCIDEGEVE
jgi:hypothetical protein